MSLIKNTAPMPASADDDPPRDRDIGRAHGNDIHFAAGITPDDLSMVASDDGQHLLILCRDLEVAIITSMGCNVERFRFADGRHCTAEDLFKRL